MGYRLIAYTGDWEPAVRRANLRMERSGGMPFLLPPHAVPARDAAPLRLEHWLVADASDEIRGGCLLQTLPGWVDGKESVVVNVQSPLSEGLVDPRYVGVAAWMVREIVRRHPLSYSVGMGGEHMPYPRLLRALGWRVEPVPFYFRVLAGRRFLANMQLLRHHPKLGWLASVGGLIPVIPDAAFNLLSNWRARNSTQEPSTLQPPPEWTRLRSGYGFAIDRNPMVVDHLYPLSDPSFVRFQSPGGNGVLRLSALRQHAYFGDLMVVTLIEAFCQPGAAPALLQAAVSESRARGADLMVTNQTAPELRQALALGGWFSYPSNYMLALSPLLTARTSAQPIYVNRGDGDGLVNL